MSVKIFVIARKPKGLTQRSDVFCHFREGGNPDWIPDQVGDDTACQIALLSARNDGIRMQQ